MTTKKSISISSSNPFDIFVFNLEVKKCQNLKEIILIQVDIYETSSLLNHDIDILKVRLCGHLQGLYSI